MSDVILEEEITLDVTINKDAVRMGGYGYAIERDTRESVQRRLTVSRDMVRLQNHHTVEIRILRLFDVQF